LSGNTAKAIQNVDPQFIKIARIDQSLTPGRNNGFLNMLQSMKNKALSLDDAARRQEEEGTAGGTSTNNSTTEEGKSTSTPADVNNNSKTNDSSSSDDDDDEDGGPKYKAIIQSLQALQPTSVQLDDNSDQYGDDGESHFGLYIVAPAFEGLNVIKRQQLIYMILGDLMPQIEALQITSLTPDEEAAQQSA
jgi:stress-induced morphogen